MAAFASELCMRASQRVIRILVVIEQRVLPTRLVMAILARYAVSSGVHVVAAMAIHALHPGDAGEIIVVMAAAATLVLVCADETEFRIPIMIERKLRPARGGMTTAAIITTLSFVYIAHCVTGPTLGRRVLKAIPGMTRIAGELRMPALESEVGARVIERRIGPARRRMTVRTRLPKRSVMAILIAMTANAFARRIAQFISRAMTGSTLSLAVRVFERKIGT
jgi:phosphatidylglycerophosphate synthase